jgi:hypothetical protein
MDDSGLLALDHARQARLDGILDRRLSLAKNRVAPTAAGDGPMTGRTK